MSKDITQAEVIIIGAGLAGLSAAIELQKAGLQVVVIEKNPTPGGLCGTFLVNDDEFVIACNDFNGKVLEILQHLGVNIEFKKSKTKFYINNTTLVFPPDFNTILKLILEFPGVFRLWRYLKKHKNTDASLEELGNKIGANTTFGEFIKSFSYPYGTTPQNFLFSQLREELSDKYNYQMQNFNVPIHGPKAIIEAMVKRFMALGGILDLETECLGINKKNFIKEVSTSKKIYQAQYLITSEARLNQYPVVFKKGLSISKFVVSLKRSFAFPKNFHTIAYFPPNLTHVLTQIDQGIMPDELSFHVFPSTPYAKTNFCLNIYFYLPRGSDTLADEAVARIKKIIFTRLDKILPGFNANILNYQFISVADFQSLHHLSSATNLNIEPGFVKPQNYDAEKDIYYIGNSVYPPGNHTGAAMLSAMLVANQIKTRRDQATSAG